MIQNKPVAYRKEKAIPYYDELHKTTIFAKLKKIRNTLLLLIAYIIPFKGVRVALHRLRGVNIGNNCFIGMFCFIDNLYPEYVYIEDNASLNTGSMLIAHFNPSARFKHVLEARVSPIVIKEGALIAVNCVILPGVTIGENAIVSAGSVVSQNVEPCTLVRGNYAKKVGKIRI